VLDLLLMLLMCKKSSTTVMGQVNIILMYSNILSCKLSNNKFLASTKYCPFSSLAYNWTSLQQFTKYPLPYPWEDITSPSLLSSSMINGRGGYFPIAMKNFQVTTWPFSSHFICFSTSILFFFFLQTLSVHQGPHPLAL